MLHVHSGIYLTEVCDHPEAIFIIVSLNPSDQNGADEPRSIWWIVTIYQVDIKQWPFFWDANCWGVERWHNTLGNYKIIKS